MFGDVSMDTPSLPVLQHWVLDQGVINEARPCPDPVPEPLPSTACCAVWSSFYFSCPGLEAEPEAVARAAAKVSLVGVAGRLHGKDESGLLPNYPPVDF